MRFFVYLLFVVSLLFCGCQRRETKKYPLPRPVFPDKELKEIFIYGRYYPGNKEKKERFGYSGIHYCYNETKEYKKPPVFKDNLRARLYNREGKLLTEDYLRIYGNIELIGKIPEFFSKEDYLRIYGSIDSYSQVVSSYLPYDEEGHEIRIVKIIGEGREKPLWKTEALTLSFLTSKSGVLGASVRRSGRGWVFDKKKECHRVPGPE